MARGVEGTGRSRARWSILSVVLLGLVAGCSSPSVVADRVVVIGDSSGALQEPDLAAALHPKFQVSTVIRTEGRVGAIEAAAVGPLTDGGTPGVVVVNLGTDDAIRPVRSSGITVDLQPLLDAIHAVPCVVLMTVGVGADERSGSTVALQINRQILRQEAADPKRVKVVDWEHFLATLPPQSLSTYLAPDRVHPTTAGDQWLARSDLAGVEACGSAVQPTVLGAGAS